MWINYENGNYTVLLNKRNGTKIRYNDKDIFIPNRPESMDVKITNQCNYNCLFCHEASVPSGKQADYEVMDKFAQSLPPHTEIACGGGSLMIDYKHTEYFLERLKEVDAIPSITVHQKDFIKYIDIIKEWYLKELVYGIGVSLYDSNDEQLYDELKCLPTSVVHVIAGIFSEEDYNNLKNKGLKILILGYKNFRRGRSYYNGMKNDIDKNMDWLSNNILKISKDFNVVSFDNLAIEQLDMEHKVSKDTWRRFYMGDDGNFTFYVDLVEKTYALNSTSIARFPITNYNIESMFNNIASYRERINNDSN